MVRLVYRCGLAMAVVLVLTRAAGAQDAPHRCAAVSGASARLACYDAVFPPTAAVRQAKAEHTLRQFGADARPDRSEDRAEQLQARVLAVEYRRDGTRIVTLDNRQRWLLTEPGSRGHLADGDVVELRRAAMGSFMLVTAGGVVLRARRIE